MTILLASEPAEGLAIPSERLRRVPEEHPTIQEAIDVSRHGDTVCVAEGTYFENIRYRGKAIVVGSHYLIDQDTAHIARTIIVGSRSSIPDSGSVVYFIGGEDTTSVLCGLTIRGGTGTRHLYPFGPVWYRLGGGIYCNNSGARLVRNIITDNCCFDRLTAGGGIVALSLEPTVYLIIEENRITNNQIRGDSVTTTWYNRGGGASVRVSARIIGNHFERNSANGSVADGGGLIFAQLQVGYVVPSGMICGNTLERNVARGTASGGGGGAVLYSSVAIVSGNDFTENSSTGINDATSGGLLILSASFRLEGNRFLRNSCSGVGPWPNAGQGAGVFLYLETEGLEQFIANNIFSGNTGNGPGAFATWDGSEGRIPLTIINNTFVNNYSTAGSGAVFFGNRILALFTNNIVWGNRYLESWSQITDLSPISHYFNNVIMGGWPRGTETINADPGLEPGSYGLSDTSICIGAGADSVLLKDIWYRAPSADFTGLPRPFPPGSQVDIGAMESPRPIGTNQPALVLTPGSLDFRNVHPGTTSDTLEVKIRNRGMISKDLATFSFASAEYHLAVEPRLPLRIRPLTSTTVGLLFSPIVPGLSTPDTLRIAVEDDQQSELSLPVIGRGSAPARGAGWGDLFGLASTPGGPVLYLLEKMTGLAQPIGAFSPSPRYPCTAIAIRPQDSILYAAYCSLAGTELYRLSSGFGDLEKSCTIPVQDVTSMAFNSTDSLFLQTGVGKLYRTAIGSSDTLLIGLTGRPLTGLAFSPATGILWGVHHDSIFTIDTQSGNATLQWANEWNAPHASITFNGVGTMYALYGDFLVSIDKGTGMPRVIGETKVPDLQWIAMRSDIVTGMEVEESVRGPVWELAQNYPNPFNAGTVIRYQLPAETHATLIVYDVLGREVTTLVDEPQAAGEHTVQFDGSRLASGVYIYRLTSGRSAQSRRMILTK